MKLPQLATRRSANSLSSERNTKYKLQNLEQKLDDLQSEVHNTRMDANVCLTLFRKL